VVGVLESEEGWWGCCRGRGGEGYAEGRVVRVLQREEWWGCWRGRCVVDVLEREAWRGLCRGRGGEGAAEGGVVGVLEREEC
jgi:hypothetical protein